MAGVARAVVRVEIDHGVAELVGDPDRPQGWTLLVDGTAQSHVDLDDPTHLEFEYVRRLGHLVDLMAPDTAAVRAVHLGGGAWTLPRYVAATRPGSAQTVVEIDARLTELVDTRLPADDGVQVVVGDARAVLTTLPTGAADLVVLDVFAGARTPAHVTTVEFLTSVRRVLADDGIYAANIADGGRELTFARGQVAAAAAVFGSVALVVATDVLVGRRFGNLVLVASDGAIPTAGLARATASDPFRAGVLDDEQTRRFASKAVAPVDRTARPSPRPPVGFFGRLR